MQYTHHLLITKMNNTPLFTKHHMKGGDLQNRFVMAPMTRSRASQPGNVPNDLMATYYGQRSSAGLIISDDPDDQNAAFDVVRRATVRFHSTSQQ